MGLPKRKKPANINQIAITMNIMPIIHKFNIRKTIPMTMKIIPSVMDVAFKIEGIAIRNIGQYGFLNLSINN